MVLAGFLARGLMLDPSEVPSPFIDKAAPGIQVSQLDRSGSGISAAFNSADMLGQVWILNIWASWCTACTVEHPLFVQLAEKQLLPIVGLNYKDKPVDADKWLTRFGNPYSIVAADQNGKVGLDWGVYGVPETFVIDKGGVVRYKHIGPVDQKALDDTIMPLINSLIAANA